MTVVPTPGAMSASRKSTSKLDVQVGVRVDRRQRQLHRVAHAFLVDEAHVEDLEAGLVDEALLARVDAADADLAHPLGADRRHLAADLDQLLGPVAAQHRDRHAVDVAARRQDVGVEVGMGVEPEDAQLPAGLAAVPRHRADRADAQAVIAAEQDRHAPAGEFGVDRVVDGAIPGGDGVEVAVALVRRLPGIRRPAEVAAIDDVEAMADEHRADVGDAQRLGSHAGAAHAGADVGRCADQADEAIHGARWPRCRAPARRGGRSRTRKRATPTPPRRSRRSGTA